MGATSGPDNVDRQLAYLVAQNQVCDGGSSQRSPPGGGTCVFRGNVEFFCWGPIFAMIVSHRLACRRRVLGVCNGSRSSLPFSEALAKTTPGTEWNSLVRCQVPMYDRVRQVRSVWMVNVFQVSESVRSCQRGSRTQAMPFIPHLPVVVRFAIRSPIHPFTRGVCLVPSCSIEQISL